MALTHHYIVQLAALRAGWQTYFPNYILLGDDIMIADQMVYGQYTSLLKLFDMPYSVAKTHESNTGFEFAKRWFLHGEEITGFGVGGLWNVRNHYGLLFNFLASQSAHGYNLTLLQAQNLISLVYRRTLFYNKRRINSLLRLYTLFHYVQLCKGALISPNTGVLHREH